MSVRGYKNSPSMDFQQVRIVTVDPSTGRVEGVIKDGAIIQIAVFNAPLTFRWPEEGEVWRVERQGIYWYLDALVEDPKDALPNEQLAAGEAKIGAKNIYNRSGEQFVATDVSTAAEGEVLVRRGTGWNAEAIGGTGSDAFFAFNQPTPATSWVITHNLGKFPSVVVVTSAGDTIETPQVHYSSANALTLQFDAVFAGDAYLN